MQGTLDQQTDDTAANLVEHRRRKLGDLLLFGRFRGFHHDLRGLIHLSTPRRFKALN
jgi:hypothetical protein